MSTPDKWAEGLEFHGKSLASLRDWLAKQKTPAGKAAAIEAAHMLDAVDEALKALRRAHHHAHLAGANAEGGAA